MLVLTRPTSQDKKPYDPYYYNVCCVCEDIYTYESGAPGLVDRKFAVHAGSLGFDSHRRHKSERFFRSNRPGYLHPVSSELEKSGIRVAVSDCSVTERRRWRPPYQTGKTVHAHAKHNIHCGNVPDMVSYPGTVASLNKHN